MTDVNTTVGTIEHVDPEHQRSRGEPLLFSAEAEPLGVLPRDVG